jgi:hypothetical protein
MGIIADEERATRFGAHLEYFLAAWKALGVGRSLPGLIRRHGAVGAAKHLLRTLYLKDSDPWARDFETLMAGHHFDQTIEYLVLQPEYEPLFTPEERRNALGRFAKKGIPSTAFKDGNG